MNWFRKRQAKQKAKRDAALLEIYRDWPPDRVDEFLAWDNASPMSTLYWADSPKGYVSWQQGMSYKAYKRQTHEGVVLRRK